MMLLIPVAIFSQNEKTFTGISAGKISSYSFGFTPVDDWEFSMVSGINTSGKAGNLFLLTASKKIGDYFLGASYSPGLQKEFIIRKNSSIIIDDSTNIATPLNTELTYRESFGFDISYKIDENFTFGSSLRRLEQNFTDETAEPFFSVDTINFITKTGTDYNTGIWKFDFGLNWEINEFLDVSLFTNNLLFTFEEPIKLEDGIFDFSDEKSIHTSIFYNFPGVQTLFSAGTDKSFFAGAYYHTPAFGGELIVGSGLGKLPGDDGVVNFIYPEIQYKYGFIALRLNSLLFLNNEPTISSYESFTNNKLRSTFFNRYESDKILLSADIALSFRSKKMVKFVELEEIQEIYPTLTEKYTSFPFAIARVANISDSKIDVKPASKINGLNEDYIFSPLVEISPGDTAEVPFYTVVNNNNRKIEKRVISEVSFLLNTINTEPDDIIQKPVIVGGVNEWDGQIVNLSYFVKKDFEKVNRLVKEKLQLFTNSDSSLPESVAKIKFLFNEFMREMEYVSDPRASREYVQFPLETIELKGGDCDDLSVMFSAMLESIGIATAFADYKNEKLNHVNLLVNTEIPAGYGAELTQNDKKYYVRENPFGQSEIWIPLELTVFESFEKAWESGAKKFYEEGIADLGLLKSKVNIVDVR